MNFVCKTARFFRGIFIATVFFLFVAALSFAGEPGSDQDQNHVIVLVGVGRSAADREREQRFATALTLNSETLRLEKIPAGIEGFLEMPLDRQIDHVTPFIDRKGAVAAMWLNPTESGDLLLQVVVSDEGRSLVRLFKQKSTPGAEAELAATAVGLLDMTYAFDASKVDTPEVDAESPTAASSEASGEAEPIPSRAAAAPEQSDESRQKKSGIPLHLIGALVQDGPILGHRGPGFGTGGALDVSFTLSEQIESAVGLGAAFTPFGDSASPVRGGWRAWAEARASFLFSAGRVVRWGPLCGIDGGFLGIVVEEEPSPRRTLTFWSTRIIAGAAVRVAASGDRWLSLSLGLDVSPVRTVVRLRSNDETIMKTAVLGWWARLDLLVF